jgi:hypothetical protein
MLYLLLKQLIKLEKIKRDKNKPYKAVLISVPG